VTLILAIFYNSFTGKITQRWIQKAWLGGEGWGGREFEVASRDAKGVASKGVGNRDGVPLHN